MRRIYESESLSAFSSLPNLKHVKDLPWAEVWILPWIPQPSAEVRSQLASLNLAFMDQIGAMPGVGDFYDLRRLQTLDIGVGDERLFIEFLNTMPAHLNRLNLFWPDWTPMSRLV